MPFNAEPPYREKILALEKVKDYHGAYALLQDALRVYPTQAFLLRTEIFLLLKLRKIREARKKAEERMELLKLDPFFLRTYFVILEKDKAREDIERLLEGLASWHIRDEDFYVFVSDMAARIFGRAKALEVLNSALSLLPGSVRLKDLWNQWKERDALPENRLLNYKEKFKGKNVDEAIRDIENIAVLPNYAQDYALRLYLAELYKKAKQYDKAVAVYEQLLRQKDAPFTRKMLGYAYYKAGQMQPALSCFKEAFFDDPFDPFLYRTIGKIFQENQDYEGYQRLLNEALAQKPAAKHLYGLLRKAQKWQTPLPKH